MKSKIIVPLVLVLLLVLAGNANAQTTYYQDSDQDTYGNAAVSTVASTQPDGYVTDNTDCDDNNASIHGLTYWYQDLDGDGSGNHNVFVISCSQPAGYVINNCDPDDNSVLKYCDANGYQFLCESSSATYSVTHFANCSPEDKMDTVELSFLMNEYTWSVTNPDGVITSGNGYQANVATFQTLSLAVQPGSLIKLDATTYCYIVTDPESGFYEFFNIASYSNASVRLPSCDTLHQGFACGLYQIKRPQDQLTELRIDGELKWRDTEIGGIRNNWYGELNPNSIVIFKSYIPDNTDNNVFNSATLQATLLPEDSFYITANNSKLCLGQLTTIATNLKSADPQIFLWSNGASGNTVSVPTGSYHVTISGTCADYTSNTLVIDTLHPSIPIYPNINVNNDPGSCGAVVNFNTPYATLPCLGTAITDSFTWINAYQTWVVPNNIYSIQVEAAGSSAIYGGGIGAEGAVVKTTLAVTPGETLYLNVGGVPYNGGGGLFPYYEYDYSIGTPGGGLTSLGRTGNRLTDTLIVAGGAGGTQFYNVYSFNDYSGIALGENGGSIHDGSSLPAESSLFMQGGEGVQGGGGGGGYYGGEGGFREPGKGGRSYVTPVGTSNTVYQKGGNPVFGYLKISYFIPELMMQTEGLPSGSQFPIGTTIVSFEPAQNNGAKAACTFTVTVNGTVPSTPVINGIKNVCNYIGTGVELTYTAQSVENGASYVWTVGPQVTIVSGQGTGSINITLAPGFINSPASTQIRVTITASCGKRETGIFYMASQLPQTASQITGPTELCSYVGTTNEATYEIALVTFATSYIWNVPAGATIVGNTDGTSINVIYDNGFTSGNVTVQAVNSCGTSLARSLPVKRTKPSLPGLIYGPKNVCLLLPSLANPNGLTGVYSVSSYQGNNYVWVLPEGIELESRTNTGTEDLITVRYNSTYGGGPIKVYATNGCGTSTERVLNLAQLTPGVVGGILQLSAEDCPDRTFVYAVASLPSNGISLEWTVPDHGTIINQSLTSITVVYTNDAIVGDVTARGNNGCGYSSKARAFRVKLGPCTPQGLMAKGEVNASTLSELAINELEVRIDPNPSVTTFKLNAKSRNVNEVMHVRIFDNLGRVYKKMQMKSGETISFGAELKAGNYFVEVIQSKAKTVKKILKL